MSNAIGNPRAIDIYSAQNAVLERGKEIPRGADLNDYTTPGTYYAANSAVGNSIKNIPSGNVSSGFRLDVFNTTSAIGASTNMAQRVIVHDSEIKVYWRSRWGSQWMFWRVVTMSTL